MNTLHDLFFESPTPTLNDECTPHLPPHIDASSDPARGVAARGVEVTEVQVPHGGQHETHNDVALSVEVMGTSEGGQPQGLYSFYEQLWHDYWSKGQKPPIALLLEHERLNPRPPAEEPKKKAIRRPARDYTPAAPPPPVDRAALLAKYGLRSFDDC